MRSADQNKQIIRDLMNAMSKSDVSSMLALFDDDAVWEVPGSSALSGQFPKDAFAAGSVHLFSAFPHGLRFDIVTMTAEDDRVAAEVVSQGTHVSGTLYQNHYHFLFVLHDEKITKAMEFMDTKHAMEVLYGG